MKQLSPIPQRVAEPPRLFRTSRYARQAIRLAMEADGIQQIGNTQRSGPKREREAISANFRGRKKG